MFSIPYAISIRFASEDQVVHGDEDDKWKLPGNGIRLELKVPTGCLPVRGDRRRRRVVSTNE